MTGGRLNRFNIVKQSKDYDQHGEYVKLWLPELKDVPIQFVHEPWKMTPFQQIEYKVKLGVDYPLPIIQPNSGGGNSYSANTNTSRDGKHQKQMGKQRKENNKNRGQKYDMKSVKTGGYDIKKGGYE